MYCVSSDLSKGQFNSLISENQYGSENENCDTVFLSYTRVTPRHTRRPSVAQQSLLSPIYLTTTSPRDEEAFVDLQLTAQSSPFKEEDHYLEPQNRSSNVYSEIPYNLT